MKYRLYNIFAGINVLICTKNILVKIKIVFTRENAINILLIHSYIFFENTYKLSLGTHDIYLH